MMLALSEWSLPDTGYELAGLIVILAFLAWVVYVMYRD